METGLQPVRERFNLKGYLIVAKSIDEYRSHLKWTDLPSVVANLSFEAQP